MCTGLRTTAWTTWPAGLEPPDVLRQKFIDHMEAALVEFRSVAANLPKSATIETE